MPQFLVDDFTRLMMVDGASVLLSQILERSNLSKVHFVFEDFQLEQRFNTIVMECDRHGTYFGACKSIGRIA